MTGGPRLVVADANVYVDAVAHDATKALGDPPTPTSLVTNDSDLLQLGRVHGWKGRPIIDPHRFTALADGAARHGTVR
jgi:hypothetical protein